MTPPVSIVEAVRTYIATYSGLATGRPLWVDFLGDDPTAYAIIPLPGPKIIETYLNGGSIRAFPFAFQSMESTADDLERMENIGFYEAFSDWLEAQTLAGTLPTLPSSPKVKTATDIEAIGWGFLYQQGESTTGIYQIQCRLIYEQQP